MSRRPKRAAFFALAFVAVLCASPVAAQPAPDDALQAARELITVMRGNRSFKQILPSIMQAIIQGRPQVERDLDTLMPLLLDSISSRVDELANQMASVEAR